MMFLRRPQTHRPRSADPSPKERGPSKPSRTRSRTPNDFAPRSQTIPKPHTDRGHASEPEPFANRDATDRGHASEPERVPDRIRLHAVVNSMGLVELKLTNRDLRRVPDELFSLTRLEMLVLSSNRLQSLPRSICRLFRLKLLDVSHNDLRSIPDTLCNCTQLTELYLHRNRLSSLPRQLVLLAQLRSLRLSQNAFESLPAEFGQLPVLRRLDLSDNSLWSLPDSFSSLDHLRQLNLSDNTFTEFPLPICRLRRLELLDLSRNKLRNIPDDLERDKGLQELNLASNLLDAFPGVICNIRGLVALDLSDNSLSGVSMRLAKLTRLKVLLLNRNSIEHLLDNLPAIERLSINDNHLRTLSVVNMKRLRVLEASANRLDAMPHGVYNLADLEVLRLSGNRISYVSQDVVLLRRLRVLDLSNNVLKLLPQAIEEMEHLESLIITGNNVGMRRGRTGRGGKGPAGDQTAYLLTSADPPDAIQDHNVHPQMMRMLRSDEGGSYEEDGLHSLPNDPPPSPPKANGFILTGRNPFQHVKDKHKHLVTQTGEPVQRTDDDQGLVRSREWLLSGRQSNLEVRSFSSRLTGESGNRGNRGENLEAVLLSNPLAVEEITYPVAQTDVFEQRREDLDLGGTRRAFERRQGRASWRNPLVAINAKQTKKGRSQALDLYSPERNDGGHGLSDTDNASDTVTVNDAIGDELSLGDEDFEFLPLTIKDEKLMRMAGDIETMLNDQLLQPIINGSIFRKSVNQSGTLRTLQGLTGDPQTPVHSNQRKALMQYSSSALVPYTSSGSRAAPGRSSRSLEDLNGGSRLALGSGIPVLRSRADVFQVGPSGGHFRSSSNRGVNIYFPRKAVESNVTITMQVETVSGQFLEEAKRVDGSLSTLLSIGDIVHVTEDRRVDLEKYVTLTIPAPSGLTSGQLHLLTYKNDHTCVPCAYSYKVIHGFISIRTWQFSGKGAVITKSSDKFKACRAMERLLEHISIRTKDFL